jgi:hypothetical protein
MIKKIFRYHQKTTAHPVDSVAATSHQAAVRGHFSHLRYPQRKFAPRRHGPSMSAFDQSGHSHDL